MAPDRDFYLLASFLGTGTILLVVQGVIPSSLVLFSVLSVSIAGISMTAVIDSMDGLKFLFGRLLIWRVGFVILAGIDQELGWTGFMVPRLKEQVNALASAFIRAILVAIWHIPVFVYSAFRPETMAVLPYGDWIRQEGFLVIFLVAVLLFMIPWTLIGYLSAQVAAGGESPILFIVAAVLPHAVFELPALLLATAAALRWHATALSPPPDHSVGESWLLAAADFVRVAIVLVIPLLLIAAFVEAYVTPAVVLWIYGR